MDRLIEGIKRHAGQMDGMVAQTRHGIVTAVQPAKGLCKVTLQPENVQTGWIPYQTATLGLHTPPPMGAQAVVQPVNGDAQNCVVTGFIYSTSDVPPGGVSGEVWAVVAGSTFKITADGHVTIVDAAGATILLPNNGSLTMQDAHGSKIVLDNSGNVLVTGILKVNGVTVTVP